MLYTGLHDLTLLNKLVLCASPSYAKREKGSGQKDRTNASGWNAIIGNSGVRETETNRHFRTIKCTYVSTDYA